VDVPREQVRADLRGLQYHLESAMGILEKYKKAEPDDRWRKFLRESFMLVRSIREKLITYVGGMNL
jgi:hypothetical protein